jgi:excisionase family DNA binding protein
MDDRTTGAGPLLIPISQAARELGVSLGTVRRWSDLGYIKAYRTPGGQRRYSREQIAEFVRSLESGPAGVA